MALRSPGARIAEFYILHQVVVLSVAVAVVEWPVGVVVKIIAIRSIAFAVTILIYELLIRRIRLLSALFGLKPVTPWARAAMPPSWSNAGTERLDELPWKATRERSSMKTIPIVEVAAAPSAARRTVAPPARTAAEPYRAYKPRPFTRAERDHVTLLVGGLHWRAERIAQASMENLGYTVQVLPTATREDLLTGREVADIGQCSPTSFTAGNLANFLRGKAKEIGAEEVSKKYIYATFGSCGACRFGQYHQSYELALRNVGLESFRMFLMGQGLEQGPTAGGGLELDLPFLLGIAWAIVLTDVVQDMEYQTRPFEVKPGETSRVAEECIEYLYDVFRKMPQRGQKWGALTWHLTTSYFTGAMREVRRRFDRVEVDRLRAKPVVKLTGEFYVQTVEGAPNYNIHRWLEAEGAEVYPAAITIWIDYLLRFAGQDFEDHIGIDRYARLKLAGIRAGQGLLRWTYGRMRRAMGSVPHELPDQYELRRLAAPYFNSRLSGGEGDMLVGKALWSHHHKKAHMICELSPYSCMPNTMSVGAMAAVIGKHPDLLYAPLEIKGDSEVHALSRCQMILTEAKKRAQREYDEVIERIGIAPDELASRVTPEMRRSTYKVPRYGVAGTAANFALHLATRTR
jgi:predicted nucleotide-binding protein (sugar kinase/HSP70/actin superfamily)